MKPVLVFPPHCHKVADCIYELDREMYPGMEVPIRLIADEALLARWLESGQLAPLVDLAKLRGSAVHVVALPNLNEGEDTPSGAAAAMRFSDGFLVPSAIGPDINCGLRLLTSSLTEQDLKPWLKALLDELEVATPAGTERGPRLSLSQPELDQLLEEGCRYLVREHGIGTGADLDAIPAEGHFHEAHGEHLSRPARAVGLDQLGTLGAGRSHFVEVGVVEEIYDGGAAELLALAKNRVTVLIHAGARELGERTYEETTDQSAKAMERYSLPPTQYTQMSYVPLESPEGQACYHALRAAANYGWANRHVLTHQARLAFRQTFSDPGLSLKISCDSPGNTVDLERLDGVNLCLHRHSATSAYGAGKHEQVPRTYRDLGEPVILPGSMGAPSFVMVATEGAAAISLASACHGVGRQMSRRLARKRYPPHELKERLAQRGVLARSPASAELREQIPEAYRDGNSIVGILERAGVARRIARIQPRAVFKG